MNAQRHPLSPMVQVVVCARDPARHDALVAAVQAGGHAVVASTAEADVVLADLPSDALLADPFGRPVIVLSDGNRGGQEAEAAGMLPRDASPAQLGAAVRAVAAGLWVRAQAPNPPAAFRDPDEYGQPTLLTPREIEILSAIGEGLSNKAVARTLGISAHTVKFHLEAIFDKLDAATRAEAVAKGLRRGLIEV